MKPTAFTIIGILACLILSISAQQLSEEEYEEHLREGEIRRVTLWRELIQAVDPSASNDQTLDELGSLIVRMGELDRYKYQLEAATEIMDEARSRIYQIPGYADYYGNKIEMARQKFDALPLERQGYAGDITRVQNLQFQTLARLPTVDSVKVLGEFLSDERGRVRSQLAEESEPQSVSTNSDKAAMVLAEMIVNGPTPSDRPWQGVQHLQKWVQWYERVKAGKQTFRFVGDPQDYDLSGPVHEAKDPTAPRASRRVDLSKVTTTDSQSAAGEPLTLWVTGSIIVLLILGGYFYIRRTP